MRVGALDDTATGRHCAMPAGQGVSTHWHSSVSCMFDIHWLSGEQEQEQEQEQQGLQAQEELTVTTLNTERYATAEDPLRGQRLLQHRGRSLRRGGGVGVCLSVFLERPEQIKPGAPRAARNQHRISALSASGHVTMCSSYSRACERQPAPPEPPCRQRGP